MWSTNQHQRHSCKLSFLFLHRRQSSESLLAGSLYRGTVFQKSIWETRKVWEGNACVAWTCSVWQHAMVVKMNPTISIFFFQALTLNKKKIMTSSGGSRPSDKGGRGGGHPDPEIRGTPGLQKTFSALWASFWLKNKGGRPLPWICH